MILEHYSDGPLEWPPRDYEQPSEKPGWGKPMKPEGLWVSIPGEDDWPSWCRSEEFWLEKLVVQNRVILADEANIKLIGNEAEIIQFDDDYGFDWNIGGSGFTSRRINWQRVAMDYHGIVIAPYVWSCRLPMEMGTPRSRVSDWYYPWDCASGCIWNGTEAIAEFETIKKTRRRKAA
jgi:hypothetical protein